MGVPTKFQNLDRKIHATNSGIDIEQRFYFEPYSDHPDVLKALLGSVAKKGNTWERTYPAHDQWIPNCYCNEAMVTFADNRVMASSPDIQDDKSTILEMLQDTRQDPAEGTAGGIVIAHYRPLITAWKSSNPQHPDTEEFDWLDPTFTPGVRQMPWPEGLYANFATIPEQVPDTVGYPFSVPVDDIIVRRILVPEIPWSAINGAKGCVNTEEWPKKGSPPTGLFHPCPPHTLRFEGVRVLNQVDSAGGRWYELEMRFTKITEYSNNLMGVDGVHSTGWVTWNHVFTRPSIAGLKGRTGWYEIYKGEAVPVWNGPISIDWPIIRKKGGLLYSTCDFDSLFRLNP